MGSVDWREVVVIVIGSLTTLLAAFLGAWFAFRLQAKGDAVKVRAGYIQGANLNLSFLADQIQQLSAILEHLVPEGVPDESRHYVIKPIVPDNNVQFLTLDLDSLAFRSEEHTSELQSLMRISYAVFCLKK